MLHTWSGRFSILSENLATSIKLYPWSTVNGKCINIKYNNNGIVFGIPSKRYLTYQSLSKRLNVLRDTKSLNKLLYSEKNVFSNIITKNRATITTSAKTFTAEQRSSPNSSDKYLHFNEIDGYYKSSPFQQVQELNIPLHQYVWRNLDKWQNYTATVDVITGRKYTYAQLRDCSASFALRLQRNFKLTKGDVLAICLPNLPEYPGALLGAIEAGLTVTTVNPIYTAEEIARQLLFSEAKFIIGTCAGYSTLLEACKIAQKKIPIACLRLHPSEAIPDKAIDFLELFKAIDQPNDYGQLIKYDIDPNDLVILPFSSGTTGMPKGVMLSHNNITTNCEQFQFLAPCDCTQQLEVVPCLLPFFHIYGCTVIMLSRLGLGCELVTIPQFKPEDLIKSLIEYKGTVLNLVPPIALFMINHPGLTAQNIPNLHLIISGAAPIGGSDVERLLQKFPDVNFCQGYGMTETSPVVLFTPITNKRYSSTGFLTSNTEAKIIALDADESNGPIQGLGPNQTGELCVRGPQVMKGYLNNKKATEETFYPGNWLRTGDVAHYDDDGYFYITDRIKELIKVKGFQVPPAELEAILRHHPQVLDAAVFGVAHEINGEVPRALVVLRPNVEINAEDIYQYVAERVAHYKKLDGGILFVKEIPKNPTGKILRRILKEKYSS